MQRIKTFNNIAQSGLAFFESKHFTVSESEPAPSAMVMRSYKLPVEELNPELCAVGRAGAGVNNIPVEECTKRGIAVFNTPGANANAVKELVVAGLFLSSRRLYQGAEALIDMEDKSGIGKKAEKIKKHYAGPEVLGKTLGLVGLGAIGVLVAEAAVALGMKVVGYDPHLSVENAWRIPNQVKKAATVEDMLAEVDYLSLHAPVVEATKGMVNSEFLSKAKDGLRVLNFARGELVNADDMIAALDSGKVGYYVTDFADEKIVGHEKTMSLPHLGASTPEAEDNCATMACEQLRDYLLNGNIINSVNFPGLNMGAKKEGHQRLAIIHQNKPKMLGAITDAIGNENANISDLNNNSRGDIAYTVLDMEGEASEALKDALSEVDGIINLRVL